MVAIDAKTRMAVELVLRDLATKDLKMFGRLTGRTTKKASADFLRLGNAVGKSTDKLALLSGGLGKAIVAGNQLRRTVGAGFGLVDASAAFEESASKFGVVFGDFAHGAAAELDLLADKVGRPRTELIDFAATFQDTLVPMGVMREEAAGLSTDLVALAIDAASFGNKLDSDAVLDFQSALVGNHETMRKYGVVITEALLKKEAFRLGLVEEGKELSNVAKIQARLSLIQDGLSDAQGDAERTAGSYMNTMKRLKGEIQEQRVVFGQLIQQEILDAIDRMGGLDVVVGQVRIGFGFLTGVTRKFIGWAETFVVNAQKMIDELGGSRTVAAGLAGDFLTLSNFAGLYLEAWLAAAKSAGHLFLGIEGSVSLMISRVLSLLKVELVFGVIEAMNDMSDKLQREYGDHWLADIFGIDGFDTDAAILRDTGLAAAKKIAKDVEAPAGEYSDIWKEAFADVRGEFGALAAEIKERFEGLGADLDFDFELAGLFPPTEEVDSDAREVGGHAGSAFGVGFWTVAEIAMTEGLKAAMASGGPVAESSGGTEARATARASGESFAKSFVQGFKSAVKGLVDAATAAADEQAQTFTGGISSAMDQVKERFSDRSLGEDLVLNTFGAIEGGVDKFSDALVEGEADFGEFSKALLKDLTKILVKLALMKALQSAFGFASGGTTDAGVADTTALAEGGIMHGRMSKPLPIKAYRRGGIADRPQLAIFGEGGSPGGEAFVPLGPSRKIGVEMRGETGRIDAPVTLNVTSLDPRGAADVILEQMPLITSALASALRKGTNRNLVGSVRRVARGG